MASLTGLLPVSLILLPALLSFSKSAGNYYIPTYYESLRESPRLPSSPTSLDRLRYSIHKAYYQYLVTFSAYMLSNFERLLLDLFMALLVTVSICCTMWIVPPVARLMLGSLKGGLLSGRDSDGLVVGMGRESGENMSLVVTTVFGTASKVAHGTCTAIGI